MTNKPELTDEELTELALKLFDGSSFYFQSGRRPGAKTMAELLNKAACAVAELQERRKADGAEPVFFIEVEGDDWIQAGRIPGSTFDFNNLPDGINKLYAAPQPVPDSEAKITLKRLAVILHGSETDLNLLTVTAQSLMDRCRADSAESVADLIISRLDSRDIGRAEHQRIAREQNAAASSVVPDNSACKGCTEPKKISGNDLS